MISKDDDPQNELPLGDRPVPVPETPVTQQTGELKGLFNYNFLMYASYVITERAIPALADGFKPVQRRILWAMKQSDDGRFTKVANVVGDTMQYHPHGNASIEDALVVLANKRYVIEGQGNYGNIYTGDPAAASRYIECRLTELARNELFNEQLTEFVPSYDGRKKEPVALPAKLPMLLMLGAEGIAVGLATRILPHNFIELLDAQIAVLRKKPFELFPDFQQGGVMDVAEYDLGRGRVKVRAVIEPSKDGKAVIIRQVPYSTTTESLISSIEDAIRKKKLKVKSISDYTSEHVEIHVILGPGVKVERAIQSLYAFTDCEVSLNSSIIVIDGKTPREMTVPEIVRENADQLKNILKRELEYEKQRLLDEFHSKTLAQIFIENRIYKDIEECTIYNEVQQAVLDGVNKFRKLLKRDVTLEDVEMLLALRIKRISRFDLNKNRKDLEQILLDLEQVDKHLANLTRYTVSYIQKMRKKYAEEFARRTVISDGAFKAIEKRQLTANELTICLDSEGGYLGHAVKGEEQFACSSLDKLILVWKDGRYKSVTPEEKLFVGQDLLYAAVFDRQRVMTAVYTLGPVTYFKRFKFGGAILNKEYNLAPEACEVLLFDDTDPEQLFVKYKPAKHQRIGQQVFAMGNVPVKSAKARGNQMTVKSIKYVRTSKPRGWSDDQTHSTAGEVMDF